MVSIDYKAALRPYGEPIQDLAQRAIEFLMDAAKMASPTHMTFGGQEVSPIEMIALEQSRRYPEVPQSTYPPHTQNGWHPQVPFNPMIDAKKPRNSNKYTGWRIKQSGDIYAARAAKKPNKAPVPIPRKQKIRRAEWNQPNQTPRKTHIYYSRRV